EYRQGRPHGQGFLKLINGDLYQGGFRDSYPDGEGELMRDGRSYRGRWIKGCFKQGDVRIAMLRKPETCPWERFED
ncbi:MAG: hypothetical protein RIM80_05320, partial [Alphaproteobacteria bacterium]